MQQSFTILALAAAATACNLQVPAQDLADYREQALQNYSYLDQCSTNQDGKIDLTEFKALMNNLLADQKTDAELTALFKRYDLNEDGLLDLSDIVNAVRVDLKPLLDVNGKDQYLPWDHDLFTYMATWVDAEPALSVSPPDYTLMTENQSSYVTRKQLKAALPMLYPERVSKDGIDIVLEEEIMRWDYNYCPASVNPICKDVQKYAYPNRSMQQFQMNGSDFSRRKGHQHHMSKFWNHLKLRGDNNYSKVSRHETVTYDEWKNEDNMWLRRDIPKGEIPEHRFKGYFNYFDQNKDGLLTFSEMFKQAQFADISFYQMRDYHGHFDLNKDKNVTTEELVAVYTEAGVEDPQYEAARFLEIHGTGADVSNFWGYWGRSLWTKTMEYNKHIEMIRDTGVIPGKHLAVDVNKDGVISEQEVIDMYGQAVYDQLAQYSNNDADKMTQQTNFENFLHDRHRAIERLEHWFYPFDKNCDGKIQRWELGYKYSEPLNMFGSVEQIDQVYSSLDANGDGTIEFEELCKNALLKSNPYFCPAEAPQIRECYYRHMLNRLEKTVSEENPEYDGRDLTLDDYAEMIGGNQEANPAKFFFDMHDIDGDDIVYADHIFKFSEHILHPSPDTDAQEMKFEVTDGRVIDAVEFQDIYDDLLDLGYINPIDQDMLDSMYQALATHYGSNGTIDHPLVLEMIRYGFVYGWKEVTEQLVQLNWYEKRQKKDD